MPLVLSTTSDPGDANFTQAGGIDTVADPGTGAAIPVTASASIAITTGAGGETNTLAIPTFAGQLMILFMETDGGGNRVVTVASAINLAGNTTITLGDANDSIILLGTVVAAAGTLAWRVVQNDGTVLG